MYTNPRYKERLQLKFLKSSKQSAALNGTRWVSLVGDMDDFRSGVPRQTKGSEMVKKVCVLGGRLASQTPFNCHYQSLPISTLHVHTALEGISTEEGKGRGCKASVMVIIERTHTHTHTHTGPGKSSSTGGLQIL